MHSVFFLRVCIVNHDFYFFQSKMTTARDERHLKNTLLKATDYKDVSL